MKQIFMAAIIIVIGLAILATTHHASAQYAEFPDYGSSYYQTPQKRYNSGWNHGIIIILKTPDHSMAVYNRTSIMNRKPYS
jgi:hypothetical protein